MLVMSWTNIIPFRNISHSLLLNIIFNTQIDEIYSYLHMVHRMSIWVSKSYVQKNISLISFVLLLLIFFFSFWISLLMLWITLCLLGWMMSGRSWFWGSSTSWGSTPGTSIWRHGWRHLGYLVVQRMLHPP